MVRATPDRRPAPGGLALVEAFINTNDREEGRDDLASPAALAQWLRGILGVDATAISDSDLRRAIDLRESLRVLAGANATGGSAPADAYSVVNREAERASLVLRFAPEGLAAVARSKGFDGAVGLILAAVAKAMQDGTWRRFKTCQRDICQWAFYDRSPNLSGSWCDMAICGSREKAKSYYRRHKRGATTRMPTLVEHRRALTKP
jgi:predicted RNA-binding Zn ribbon-like protein